MTPQCQTSCPRASPAPLQVQCTHDDDALPATNGWPFAQASGTHAGHQFRLFAITEE